MPRLQSENYVTGVVEFDIYNLFHIPNGTEDITYQWRRDGVDIPGEISRYYVVASPADDGATLTCEVTATNTEGATVVVSNGIDIPGVSP